MNLQKKMQELGDMLEKEIKDIGTYLHNNPYEANKNLVHYNSVLMALKFSVVNFDLVAQAIQATEAAAAMVKMPTKSDTVN